MKKIALVIAVPFFALVVSLMGDNVTPDGYFKDAKPNRVMSYTAPADLSPEAARAALDNLPHTTRQHTVAVLYAGQPGPGEKLTLASDYGAAIDVIYAPGHDTWRYRADYGPTGEFHFLDCATSRSGVCPAK